ncbi:MAG: DUF167 domain-containing protein [Myxococcota bacterium]
MEPSLEAREEGVVVCVRVAPRARRDAIAGVHDGRLKVAVTAPPEKGKANDAVARVLARALGVPRSRVALLAGATSHDKRFLISGEALEAVRARLRAQVEAPRGSTS